MSVKAEYIKIIRNVNGDEIFKLPQNVTLDIIPLDLWNDIAKYKCPLFVLCEYPNLLPGFRQIKKKEFESIKPDFLHYYNVNEGILNIHNISKKCIDGYHTYFMIDGCYTKSDRIYVTCTIEEKKIRLLNSLNEKNLQISDHLMILDSSTHQHLVLMVLE